MAIFEIDTFSEIGNSGKASAIDIYRIGIEDTLCQLQAQLLLAKNKVSNARFKKILAAPFLDTEKDLTDLILESTSENKFFASYNADLQNYPHLWSMSSRIGNSKLSIKNKNEQNKIDNKSTFEHVQQTLYGMLNRFSRFNKDEREIREIIIHAIAALEIWQQDNVLDYLKQLRIATAGRLIALLPRENAIEDAKLNEELIALQSKLAGINNDVELRSRADVFDFTKNVNRTRNDLLAFNKKYSEQTNQTLSVNFEHLSKQLSIIAKRESDYYYDHPKEFTRLDQARKIARATTASIGSVSAILAVVFVFIPGMQLIALVLGAISAVALYPVIDTMIETGRHFYYGRSPTKAQTAELGIAVPILATLMAGAYALPAIGLLISAKFSAVGQTLSNIGHFIANRFTNSFSGFFNTLGSIKETAEATNSFQEKAVSNKKIVEFQEAAALFHEKETDLQNKGAIIKGGFELAHTHKNSTARMGYLYKEKSQGKPGEGEIVLRFRESHSIHIHKWDAGFFSSAPIKEIEKLVHAYRELPTNSPLETRMEALLAIENKIFSLTKEEQKGTKIFSRLKKLVDGVHKELDTLSEIKAHGELYLTNKPK